MSLRLDALRVRHPVMIASGCGGTGRELLPYLGDSGWTGLVFVTRSIGPDPRPGNRGRGIEETPAGLLYDADRPTPGVAGFLATELPWLLQHGATVVVSITGRTPQEQAAVARQVGQTPGVAGVEVAIDSARQAREVLPAVLAVLPRDLPVLVKLRPDPDRVVELARTVRDLGAAALVVGQALRAALSDGRAAGLSGPVLRPLSLLAVRQVAHELPDVPLVAGGGISQPSEARAFLAAGAQAVQVGTAVLHDPSTPARLRAGLTRSEEES